MHKSFVLVGFMAAVLISQGCGGKKEVANLSPDLPTPVAARPTTISLDNASSGNISSPSMGKGEEEGSSEGSSQNSGGAPAGSPGGPPRGYGQSSPEGGSSSSGGGPSGYDQYQQQGNSGGGSNQSFGMNMDDRGGNSPNGGNSQQGAGNRNPNRGNRPPKPQTFKDQAVTAFQSGNSKQAYTLLQAHALNVSDEEAAEILKDYRWAAHRKRPQLGINIAVGVTLKNPLNSTDLSPIGAESRTANGGGGSDSGFSGSGMSGRGMSGGNTPSGSKGKTLAETTGEFGANLVAAFKGKHDSGVWSPAFKEYSLASGRGNGAPRGGFGGGFGGGFSGGNSGDLDGGNQPGSSENGGYPSGFGQPGNAQGGGRNNFGSMPDSGYQPDGSGAQSGNANSGSNLKGRGEMTSGDLKFLQGSSGIPKKGLLSGGDNATSTEASSTSPSSTGPSSTGPSFSKDVLPILRANCFNCHSDSKRLGGYSLSEFDIMLRGGESGTRAIVPGNSSESNLIQEIVSVNGKAAMPKKGKPLGNKDINTIKRWIDAGAINDSQSSGSGSAGGPRSGGSDDRGTGDSNSSNSIAPSFVANVSLPPGTSALAPCLNYIGVDEPTKLIRKAAQEGYDGLLIFEVTIGRNPVLRRVTNDTFVRIFQPNSVPKDAKKFYGSKTFKNLMVAKSRSKSEPDGLDEEVAKVVKETEEAFHLESIPAALTPEIIAKKRVPTLVKDTEMSVIDRLSEVNLYYSKGLLDESQKADAFEQIAGSPGKAIATGSPTERLAAIEKLLEREFK